MPFILYLVRFCPSKSCKGKVPSVGSATRTSTMRGTFAVSKYVAKAMLVRRWTARIVWGMQRQAAAQILATGRANAFLRSRSQSAAATVVGVPRLAAWRCCPPCSCSWYEYGSRDFAGRFGLDFLWLWWLCRLYLYLVRFCSSKSCNSSSSATVRRYPPKEEFVAVQSATLLLVRNLPGKSFRGRRVNSSWAGVNSSLQRKSGPKGRCGLNQSLILIMGRSSIFRRSWSKPASQPARP